MVGDRIIEISKFKLSYDGLFTIEFKHAGKLHTIKPYLTPAMFYYIIANEGLKETIQLLDFYSEGVVFSKTKLLFEVFDNENGNISFLTSEEAEHYQDSGYYLVHCEIK